MRWMTERAASSNTSQGWKDLDDQAGQTDQHEGSDALELKPRLVLIADAPRTSLVAPSPLQSVHLAWPARGGGAPVLPRHGEDVPPTNSQS